MSEQKQQPSHRVRGIYLLPNLLTMAGMFAGFYAVVAALKGVYNAAAIAIFIAMITDAFDGRVARLTNTQTSFGRELDSISDMVAFGVAPALVVYSWSLGSLGKLGWLAAFVFTACAGLRLARFNTQAERQDKRYFQGLPSPSAAAVIASLVWLGHNWGVSGVDKTVSISVAVVTVLAALAMVSNMRYSSFKTLQFKGKVPFVAILVVVVIFVLISINPPLVLFLTFLAYGVSGPALTLYNLKRKRRTRKRRWRK